MATIVNDRDVLLQAAATRYVEPPLSGTLDFDSITGAHKPANNATVGATWGVNIGSQPTSLSGINSSEGSKLSGIASGADVTSTILASSGTSIVMSNANLFKSSTGIAGVFIGSGGLVGKDSSGNTTFSINGSTGAASFKGDITGGSNINITGQAFLGGVTSSGGGNYALVANAGGNSNSGILSYGDSSGGTGIIGKSNFNGTGVNGTSYNGYGVYGAATASGGTAVVASASGGAQALAVGGTMAITNSTLVSNLNAQYLNGLSSSAFLGASAQAVDSAQLAGYGPGSWLRQTGVTTGTLTPNYILTVVSGGITVGIACKYPYP